MAFIDITQALGSLNIAERNGFEALAKGITDGVLEGQGIVQGKASGRPGPRVRTGNYRRSIVGDVSVGDGEILGQIGTNQPQGPRLEFGFSGTDILGRTYDQSPFPHFLPSVKPIKAVLIARVLERMQGIN